MSFFNWVTNYLEPVAYLLYLVALFIYYKSKSSRTTYLLYSFYFLMVVVLTIGCWNVGKKGHSNIWAYDLTGLFSSVVTGIFFYQLLKTPLKKKVVLLATACYLIYAVYRNYTLEGRRLFDSAGYAILSASIVIYVLMYFHQVMKNVTENNILRDFEFWLSSSYLLYYVGSFIIFLSYFYLTGKVINTLTLEERKLLTALWGFHNVLLFVSALALLTGSLWLTYRRKSG